jgi:glutaredoxin
MHKRAIFYHAGCPVCNAAEQTVADALDPQRFEVQRIHLGEDRKRLPEAEAAGVKSVPALVIDGQPYHINYGASLEDVRGS